MICSQCKKRTAVVFINKIENGVSSMEGLCKECAKKRGLDVPETNTNQSTSNQTNNNIDMNNMSKQLESLFKDLSSNLKLENLENMDFENFESDGDEDVDDENAPEGISMGIPIGSIFANFVPKKQKDEEETNGGRQKVKVESKKSKKKKKYLDTFGTNLTQKAKNNELDMVIGRDKEIQRVIQILNRRTKNNPCLIGEPGVGKTAIAQGLAIKIANNNVPAKLLNKEVYLLDMTSVIAGTQFRGQFEARMKGIIDECKEFKNIIFKILGILVVLGIIVELGAATVGIPILGIVYAIDLNAYVLDLIIIIFGAILYAIAGVFSTALITMRRNGMQLIIYLIDAIFSVIISYLFISTFGIHGATIGYTSTMVLHVILYTIYFLYEYSKLVKSED